jgi:hypothetical protein
VKYWPDGDHLEKQQVLTIKNEQEASGRKHWTKAFTFCP